MNLKLLGISLLAAINVSAETKKTVRGPSSFNRPPQFVLLAFDGSSSLDMWRETVEFADTVNTVGLNNQTQKVKFTYFINPTYYTESAHKGNYLTPALNKPVSCIGWAAPAGSVMDRLIATNRAFEKGHEIASHANSHCSADGSNTDPLKGMKWSEAHWTSEFNQFNKLLFDAVPLNKIKPPPNFVMRFNKSDIIGFRAPALAVTPGLWPTLGKFGFKYDTSKISSPTYWPQRQEWGGWNIPLAQIKIAGATRKTLNMDYNWFVYHSAATSIPNITPAKVQELKNQVLNSYKYYFKTNYFGNRAPVQIGHHFSKWNGGAYWLAMKEFTQFVCNKPEVKCVTMKDFVKWVESLPANELLAYRNGQFSKLPDDKTIKDISAQAVVSVRLDIGDGAFEAMTEANETALAQSLGLRREIIVNFKPTGTSRITNEDLAKIAGTGTKAIVRAALVNKAGQEVNWETYTVDNVGTAQQKVSDAAVEDSITNPEPASAHEHAHE